MRMRLLVGRSATPATLGLMTSLFFLWLLLLLLLLTAQETGAASFIGSSASSTSIRHQRYVSSPSISSRAVPSFTARRTFVNNEDNNENDSLPCSSTSAAATASSQSIVGRRTAVATLILVGASGVLSTHALAADSGSATLDDDASFAAIAARATEISKVLDKEAAATAANIRKSEKTAYDFELPIAQENVKFADVIRQEFYSDGVKVKAT